MAGASTRTNAAKQRKRVEADTSSNNNNTSTTATLLRAKDGSAFALCEGCNKSVAVALISMHNCSLDAKIRVNLEAQVVETQAEAKKKPAEKKKSSSEEPKSKRLRKGKDEKKSSSTSNKTKRPLTAFFIFMNDFRKTFKEENPGANVKDVAKQGGEKWKSLTEEEKKFYTDKAAELKAEYNKSLENNDAVEEEEVEEKEDDTEEKEADTEEKEADEAEEKKADDANEAEEKEVENTDHENKEAEGKEVEEEILDDY